MEELRLERREGDRVVVSNSSGDEFVLVADETLLAEVRSAVRHNRGVRTVSPAEIQKLIREGRTRDEIIETLDVEMEDIERYEAPVLAERQYILQQAHAVPVRTHRRDDDSDQPQRFGDVIAERLIGIQAIRTNWSSWRDQEAGWQIALEFHSHDVDHRALWSFDHRKNVLTPLNPDAVTLSKQSEPGDRLIPKLRAVDHPAAAQPQEAKELPSSRGAQSSANDELFGASHTPEPAEDSEEAALSDQDEFDRRQQIDEIAISSNDADPKDLGETQDLLRELRRRRGQRESQTGDHTAARSLFSAPGVTGAVDRTPTPAPASDPAELPASEAAVADLTDRSSEEATSVAEPDYRRADDQLSFFPEAESSEPEQDENTDSRADGAPKKKRGRAAIPSWDDILFGTRSEEDPS